MFCLYFKNKLKQTARFTVANSIISAKFNATNHCRVCRRVSYFPCSINLISALLLYLGQEMLFISRAVNFFNSLALLINPSLIASRYTLLNACIFATYLAVVYVSSPFILSFCHCLLLSLSITHSISLFLKKLKKSWFPASKASLFFKNFCQRRELFAFIKRIFNPKNS